MKNISAIEASVEHLVRLGHIANVVSRQPVVQRQAGTDRIVAQRHSDLCSVPLESHVQLQKCAIFSAMPVSRRKRSRHDVVCTELLSKRSKKSTSSTPAATKKASTRACASFVSQSLQGGAANEPQQGDLRGPEFVVHTKCKSSKRAFRPSQSPDEYFSINSIPEVIMLLIFKALHMGRFQAALGGSNFKFVSWLTPCAV